MTIAVREREMLTDEQSKALNDWNKHGHYVANTCGRTLCFSGLKCCGQHLRFGPLPRRKRIPSQAKLWIYAPVIPNTYTHTPTSCGCVQEKLIKSDISTGHKINIQILSERHSQAVLPMLGIPRTKNIRSVEFKKRHLQEIPGQEDGVYRVVHMNRQQRAKMLHNDMETMWFAYQDKLKVIVPWVGFSSTVTL